MTNILLIGRWQTANAHIRSPKQAFQVDGARAHWSLADFLFLKHIPLNYSWRQTLSSSQSTMDNLIRLYNFLDLTSVGKGNALVSQARASNVIVIMGFGVVQFPLVTGCHVLFCAFRGESLEELRESCKEVRSVWISPWESWGSEENDLKQFQLSVCPFNQFPAGVWQKVDNRKEKGCNKVQHLYKGRKKFPRGKGVEEEREPCFLEMGRLQKTFSCSKHLLGQLLRSWDR